MGRRKARGGGGGAARADAGGGESRGGRGRAYPLALRMRVVEQAMTGGVSLGRLSQLFGPSVTAIVNWVNAYEKGGVDALVPKPAPPPPRRTSVAQQAKQQAVVGLREEHPEYGTRRIRDLLARVEGLGVSETQVRTILHEAGLIEPRPATAEREHGPRRFERAAPNQMWQSDIFTFLLRRHERLYLTAFMDDHSRFLVSTALAHHQRSTLVMEALARGIAAYGTPQEILTDQGRQYTAWRGASSPGHPARQEPSAAPADARKGGAILEDALGGVSEPNGVCGLRRLRAAARALRGRVQLPASAPGHRRDGARRPLLPVGAAGARSDREDDCRERAAARARAAGAQALLLGRPARRPGSDDRGRRQRAARADGQRTARDDPFTEGGSR